MKLKELLESPIMAEVETIRVIDSFNVEMQVKSIALDLGSYEVLAFKVNKNKLKVKLNV